MIEVRNLTKRYGDNVAVNNLNFTVENGKIYGFLGPNGAGKSTTMNIMTGYLASTEGEVLINGHDILEEPEAAKKSIGYLPEIPPLYLEMTIYEYLCVAADLKKVPKAERKKQIAEIMDLVKITSMSGRLIKHLSKGYRQRVGLAQALLGFPDTIILDEPTVGLDPKQIIEIRDLIRSLSKDHTIILSSHILAEVSAVCDHIMIMSQGRLVASDTPENLSKKAANENILTLTIKGERSKIEKVLKEILNHKAEMDIIRSAEADAYDIRLNIPGEEDIREALFYKLAVNELPVLAMKNSAKSLEDIFLELTGSKGNVRRGKTA